MTTLYVQRNGCTLTRRDNSFIVRYKEGDRVIKQPFPAEKINEVVIGTGCQITSGAIELLMALEVPVSFVNFHDRFIGALCTPINGNQALRRAQYTAADNTDFGLTLAKRFIIGKTNNQRTIVLRYARECPALDSNANQMRQMIAQLECAPDVETVMGLEGQTAKLYFEALGVISGDEWAFNGRNRRPPRDPVNAMLSYGYAVLEGHITSALHRVGLDPYVGFMHKPFPGRRSLALDLLEEFRPVIVDSAILGIIGNRLLQPGDFAMIEGSCSLSDDARKTFLTRLQGRFDQPVAHPITQEKTTYGKLVLSQARQIGSILMGELTEYVPIRIR